jgi:hypothetical protein
MPGEMAFLAMLEFCFGLAGVKQGVVLAVAAKGL